MTLKMKLFPQTQKTKIKKVLWLVIFLMLFSLITPFKKVRAQAEELIFMPSSIRHATALQECQNGNWGLECTVQMITVEVMNSLSFSAGGDPTGTLTPVNQGGGGGSGSPPPGGFNRGGAIQFASSAISRMLSTPPVSSREFTQYLAGKLNLAEPAYAQGTGYVALSPFIRLWTVFRNISYMAFILIFIIIGFMIMFRTKIDPQTAISVQNSLPKLIITLILITFSYAIAGFMIDLIYLLIYLVVAVFASQHLINNPDLIRTILVQENLFSLVFKGSFWQAGMNVGEAIDRIITDVIRSSAFVEWIAGSVSNALATVIITGALLYSVFRLFFSVIIAYIQIILSTIFAPFMILFNAFPGSQSFGNWLKNLLANVLIFPALAVIFLISAVIIGPCPNSFTPDPADCPEIDWQIADPPLFDPGSPAWLPPFTGFTTHTIPVTYIIAYGMILFAPQVASLIKQSIKAKPLPMAGVFQPIAVGASAASSVGKVAAAPVTAPWNVLKTIGKSAISQVGETMAGEGKPRSG